MSSVVGLQRIAALLAIGWLGCCTGVARAQTHAPSSAAPVLVLNNARATPPAYFGMHVHHLAVAGPDGKLTAWPSVPFGSLRLWDAGCAWPNVEPRWGEWDFKTLDRYVALARRHHVRILLPLALTPAWASSKPGQPSAYGPGAAAPLRSLADWREYVLKVARRYKGQIHYYELWNEINSSRFYSGSMSEMVELEKVAFQALKSVDPDNQLVSPSMYGGGKSIQLLARFFADGGGRYADIIGYHFYVAAQAPEAMIPLIGAVKNEMTRYGIADKPLWNTETGWWIANTDGTPEHAGIAAGWVRLQPEQAADYVARALIIGRAAGLSRFFWYAWDNQGMGLINPTAQSLKPAALAYARSVQWLSNQSISCDVNSATIACNLLPSKSWIIWSTSPHGSYWTAPAGWEIAQADPIQGRNSYWHSSATLHIGGAPVLVRLVHR